jgi:hypothetical protein
MSLINSYLRNSKRVWNDRIRGMKVAVQSRSVIERTSGPF